MSAPTLTIDTVETWCGHPRLLADSVMLGFIIGPTLATIERDWVWAGLEAFRAAVLANPAATLACADGAMAEARTNLGIALADARDGDAAGVRRRLEQVDNALAVAKAWRELAGYDPA